MTKFLMNNKLITAAVIIILGLLAYTYVLRINLDNTEIAYGISSNNEKAYAAGLKTWEDRYGQEHARTIMFNENLSAFKVSQDSITRKLVAIIQDQGISLNKLRDASYIQTKIATTLTKEIRTSLPDTVVDLSNKDIKNIITLSPYSIKSDIELYNTQAILFSDSTYKNYIPYRKSFFISRWLQKKDKVTVINAEVINSNPLIKTQEQKFIHIIKN